MDNETLQNVIDKIFESSHFSAEIDRKLLQFLIDSRLRALNETSIAHEFFKRDKDFNPLDSSIVRSHTYSLRKKLETYYLSEGANDKIRLSIPKGHYKVEFIYQHEPEPTKPNKLKPYYILSLIIFVLLLAIVYFWQKTSNLEKENQAFFIIDNSNIVWSDFLNSELPTLLVIGDYYVFQKPQKIKEKELFVRDTEINSNEDLERFLQKHPGEKNNISRTSLTYLGSEVPAIVTKLVKVFRGNEEKLKVKLSSELLWSDLKKYNIIFVGSPKTLGKMDYFADRLRFKISLFPNLAYYTPNYKDTVNTYSLISYYQNGFHDDYSIMAKFPTSDKNYVMLIISFSSFGKTEILDELISPSFMDKLKEQNFIKNNFSRYFEILFKVHGIDKSGLNIKVIHFHEIKSKIVFESNIKESAH